MQDTVRIVYDITISKPINNIQFMTIRASYQGNTCVINASIYEYMCIEKSLSDIAITLFTGMVQ